jgi:hypothetical protein
MMDFRFGNTNAKPMSSYLLMLAIGKFEKIVKNQNQNFLEMYLEKKRTKFEPTYRDSKRMFDFRKGNRIEVSKFINKRLFEISCMPEWKTHRQRCSIRVMWSILQVLKTEVTQMSMHMN